MYDGTDKFPCSSPRISSVNVYLAGRPLTESDICLPCLDRRLACRSPIVRSS
ncbi:hypothetical protein DPMN_098849 [Dreissena polymorpha]|uniref:Uncharacterized protein n=1 Tax=Dreissena polymorpha TaxID=45954 RepID=A0A9D4LEF1_DREPO|nr:hypothetical protein DPMN_098849 [Dreissena polymorpha]